jgi:hypothetical protein
MDAEQPKRLTMNRKEFAERVGISVRTLDTEAHAEELLDTFEVRARERKGRLRVVNSL